jgi:hypothetical protein
MGRSVTPAYRIEIIDQRGYKWATPFPLKATEANLKFWVETFNNGVLNGVNQHLGPDAVVRNAKLVSQKGARRGEVVVEASF